MKNPIKTKAIATLVDEGFTKDTTINYENIQLAIETLHSAEIVSFTIDYQTSDGDSWFSILYFCGKIERTVIFCTYDDMYYDDLDEFVETMLEIEDDINKWESNL